jgi:hypothetical protein
MTAQLVFSAATVPAVVGLVQVCKDLGLPTRAAPAAAVTLGVLAALLQLYAGTWPALQAVAMGITLGLSASGLYAGAQSLKGAPGAPAPAPAPAEPAEDPGVIRAPAPTPKETAAKPATTTKPRRPRVAKPKPAPGTDGRTTG